MELSAYGGPHRRTLQREGNRASSDEHRPTEPRCRDRHADPVVTRSACDRCGEGRPWRCQRRRHDGAGGAGRNLQPHTHTHSHPESDGDRSGGPHSDRFGDSGDAAHGVGQPRTHRLPDRHTFPDADPHLGTHSCCASGHRNVHDLPNDPPHCGRRAARQRDPGLVVDAQPPSCGNPPRRVRDRRSGPGPGGAGLDGGDGHGDDRQRISSGSRARRARGSGGGERPTDGRGGGLPHIDTRVLRGQRRGADPSRVGRRFVLSPLPGRHGGPDRRRRPYPTAGRRVGQATDPGRSRAPDAVHATRSGSAHTGFSQPRSVCCSAPRAGESCSRGSWDSLSEPSSCSRRGCRPVPRRWSSSRCQLALPWSCS